MKGLEAIWVIGDDFVMDTAGQYLQNPNDEKKLYLQDKYELKIFNSSKLSVVDNVAARIHNEFIGTVKQQMVCPKAIIVVLDGDMVKNLRCELNQTAIIYQEILKNLMSGLHRAVITHKERLPIKGKKLEAPTILWTLAPFHDKFPEVWNLWRTKFNAALVKCAQLFPEMGTLTMKKIWDPSDPNFLIEKKFTALGLSAYWESVDSAFWHWDTFLFLKILAKFQFNKKRSNERKPGDFISREVQQFKKAKAKFA